MKTFSLTILLLAFCLLSTASWAETHKETHNKSATIPFFGIFPLIAQKTWYLSDGWANGEHQACEWSKYAVYGFEKHLRITLSEKPGKLRPYRCGEIHTTQRFGYGRYEAHLKTAKGSGLNTAFFSFIGPPNGEKVHDEIDIEFLGKDARLVQFSYWHDAKNYDVKVYELSFDPSEDYHDYAYEWHKDKIIWFVDGKEVYRTSGKHPMPSNPGMIFFSLWAGAKPIDGWLGSFDYKGPQHYDIEWVKFTPYSEK